MKNEDKIIKADRVSEKDKKQTKPKKLKENPTLKSGKVNATDSSAVAVPPIYYWEDDGLMTAAVRWEGMNFGLSFPLEENHTRNNMNKKKLTTHLKEVVSVLVLHGSRILDSKGQLHPDEIRYQEALRWKYDKLWDQRIKAVDQLMRIKEINKEQARRLKLL